MVNLKKSRRTVSSKSDDGEALVIYIHGIGRQLPLKELKLEWDLALFGRDRGEATQMAYWSDIVHPPETKGPKIANAIDELDSDAILTQVGIDPDNEDAKDY